MNRFSLSLGTWFGIPVSVHWSWLLLLVFLVYAHPNFALLFLGIFGIVLLHEFGHCMGARYTNTYIHGIVLYPMGGAAQMGMTVIAPKKELIITVAGPAVNLALIPILGLLEPTSSYMAILGIANWYLLLFNLIPAFPLDGGRILRAGLAFGLKDYRRATIYAARIGQVFAAMILIWGIINYQLIICLIAAFIFWESKKEIAFANRMTGLAFGDVGIQDSGEILDSAQRRIEKVRRKYNF